MPQRDSEVASRELEVVFRRHYRRLVEGLAMGVGSEAADDAVQEAFVQAYRRWDKIRYYDDPVAWLRRVAVNRLLNEGRSARRRRAALPRIERREMTDPDPSSELSAEITLAVRALPRRQQVAVALYYLCDRSIAEVALDMGVTSGAVKQHLFQARHTLRGSLERLHES